MCVYLRLTILNLKYIKENYFQNFSRTAGSFKLNPWCVLLST